MLPAKIVVVLLLMGSIPMWIRLVAGSAAEIGAVRLSWGLALTLLVFWKHIDLRAVFRGSRQAGVPFYLLPCIGLLFGAHWLLYFESIQRSSASLGILALSTYGVHVTWMGALFSSRRPTGRDWVAVLGSSVGAWFCAPSYDAEGQALFGFGLGMLSAVFYAALPILHQRAKALSLPTRGTAQFFFAWLLFVPLASTESWQLDTRSWVALTVLGIFCTFVAHNLWIEVTTLVRPSTSGLLYYLAIPVTMVLDTLVLGNPPQPSQWLGAGLILSGNAFAWWAGNQTVGRPPAETSVGPADAGSR